MIITVFITAFYKTAHELLIIINIALWVSDVHYQSMTSAALQTNRWTKMLSKMEGNGVMRSKSGKPSTRWNQQPKYQVKWTK